MEKVDSITSARTEVDSEKKVEVPSVSNNDTKPLVVGSQSNGTHKEILSKEELVRLFDEKYGCLDDSTVLSHQEYLKHRQWQVDSGFFAFRFSQSSY